MSFSLPSRVDKVSFEGREFYVKRDDLIDTCLSGNKYRKLYELTQTPSNTYTKVISYGGGQSNAMYSISCLCKTKGWEFHYYTKTLPAVLRDEKDGNLGLAIKNGMIVHEVEHDKFYELVENLHVEVEEKVLVISQGGADEVASSGVKLLADEINLWKKEKNIDKLSVVLPSGTGSTSVFLKQFLHVEIELYTVVLVGDEEFQLKQWQRLSYGPYPKILPSNKTKFAKPYKENLEIYEKLKEETKIEFDLIYAPKTWLSILKNIEVLGTNILYIHTGGVSGNQTMLNRYAYKNRKK